MHGGCGDEMQLGARAFQQRGWGEPQHPAAPKAPRAPPDCQQTDPAQQQLREQLEDALRLAERFTRRYDELLRAFQAEMLNTSSLLEQLNRQFGWVSRLANLTQGTDGFLQVTTVRPRGRGARNAPVPQPFL